MEVKVAKTAGFCFGVKRAVDLVYAEAEKNPNRVFTMGPIIHNEQVVDDLSHHGVRIINDDLQVVHDESQQPAGEAPYMPGPDDTVIIRSHGITRALKERLAATGANVVDATCPFVSKIHRIVAEKSREGYAVVIIGNANHPEVVGIKGWAEGPCVAVETEEDARRVSFPGIADICVVSQTTFNLEKFHNLVAIIDSLGYHVVVTNTICNATRERQAEAVELARNSGTMLVIGGRHSSNTQKLYELCKGQCVNTYYIQQLDDLVTIRLQSDECVGITAGASTPNSIIQEVATHVRRT